MTTCELDYIGLDSIEVGNAIFEEMVRTEIATMKREIDKLTAYMSGSTFDFSDLSEQKVDEWMYSMSMNDTTKLMMVLNYLVDIKLSLQLMKFLPVFSNGFGESVVYVTHMYHGRFLNKDTTITNASVYYALIDMFEKFNEIVERHG